MNTYNPIDLLFGGMEKLGPGGNAHTLHVLRLLPTQQFHVIVDAGCGTGRQTLVLAKALGTLVHAVDAYEPFLHDLTQRTKAAGISILYRRIAWTCRTFRASFTTSSCSGRKARRTTLALPTP